MVESTDARSIMDMFIPRVKYFTPSTTSIDHFSRVLKPSTASSIDPGKIDETTFFHLPFSVARGIVINDWIKGGKKVDVTKPNYRQVLVNERRKRQLFDLLLDLDWKESMIYIANSRERMLKMTRNVAIEMLDNLIEMEREGIKENNREKSQEAVNIAGLLLGIDLKNKRGRRAPKTYLNRHLDQIIEFSDDRIAKNMLEKGAGRISGSREHEMTDLELLIIDEGTTSKRLMMLDFVEGRIKETTKKENRWFNREEAFQDLCWKARRLYDAGPADVKKKASTILESCHGKQWR
jgi:hypothetical protein